MVTAVAKHVKLTAMLYIARRLYDSTQISSYFLIDNISQILVFLKYFLQVEKEPIYYFQIHEHFFLISINNWTVCKQFIFLNLFTIRTVCSMNYIYNIKYHISFFKASCWSLHANLIYFHHFYV